MLTIRQSQINSLAQSRPNQVMTTPCPFDEHWIEVQLVDEDGNPTPNEKYRITLPDSSVHEGTLDDQGKARFDGILGGNAQITFPDIDGREWKPG